MSALLVVLLVLGSGVAHQTGTFLRLTALRSDQGVWTARFGEYEISIQLRHHLTPGKSDDYNDTWTVKIKHTPKQFGLWEEKEEEQQLFDDITGESNFHESESKETLTTEEATILKRIEPPPRKLKKSKKRRQLPNKFSTTTTEKNVITQPDSSGDKDESFSELAQGSTRINVVYDKSINESTNQEKTSNTDVHEDQWKNIAAVIYDGFPVNSESTSNVSKEENVENTYDADLGRLSEPYALPLQQSSPNYDYDEVDTSVLTQNTRSSNSFTADTQEVPKYITDDAQARQTLGTFNEENIDAREKESNQTSHDYVVEDPIMYDGSEEGEGNSQDDSKGVDFSDLEATPEIKRLAQWYPRSKPLAFDNNGYKLFPGVGWYKLIPWAERWSNASKVCHEEGAHLAVPNSRDEVGVFLQIFSNFPDVLERSILTDQVYVGVYNTGGDTQRKFRTVQDELYEPDFPIWLPGEPDNADPGEDCVTFHKNGKIRDVPCFYNLPFLCEKEPDIS